MARSNGIWVFESAMRRSRVAVVSTGGTIASVRKSDSVGATASVPVSELLREVGDLAAVEIGPVEDLASVNSWNVGPRLMWRVAECVSLLAADVNVDGIVVTHGTDTIEETAFLVDVLTCTDKPVVFTAAMRTADALSPDGPRNLTAALRAAGSPVLVGLGALVCLDNELHAARWVRKWHTYRSGAMAGVPGAVATVDPDGGVRRSFGMLARWTAPSGDGADKVKPDAVPVLQAYTGMSAAPLRAVVDATAARGIIIEGYGLGHVPEALLSPIAELLANDVLVVVATRVPVGGTWPVYGGRGGGTDLATMGVLSACGLSGAKARLLLLACLAGHDAAAAARTFREAVAVLGRGVGGETP